MSHSMWNGPNFGKVPTWNFVKSMYPSRNENPESLLSSHEWFQNYSHLNYEPFSLCIESLQFMAFWKCYLESFNSKHLKFWIVTHFLEVFTAKNLFSQNFKKLYPWWSAKTVKLTTLILFFTFSVGYNLIRKNSE